MKLQFGIFDTFLAVSEEESMAKAANRVGLSQAAVTKQMQALENILELELFEKKRAPKRLNDNGKAFRNLTLMYMTAIEKFKTDRHASPDSLTGNLFICSSYSSVTVPLYGMLASFESTYPSVSVNILHKDYKELTQNPVGGLFALVPETEDIPGARQIKVLDSIVLGVAIPKGIPLASKNSVTVNDILNHKLIMTEDMISNSDLSAWLNGKTPNIICDNLLITQTIINNGGGITILPTYFQKYIANSCIKIVPLLPSITIKFKLVYLGYGAMSLAETAFVKHLEKP